MPVSAGYQSLPPSPKTAQLAITGTRRKMSSDDPAVGGSSPGTFTLNINDLPIRLSQATQQDLSNETNNANTHGSRIQSNINHLMQDIWPQIEQRITQQAVTALRSHPNHPQDLPAELALNNPAMIQLGAEAPRPQAHRDSQPEQPVPNVRNIVKAVEGCLPFVILILAKVFYNHRLGILVFVGLFGTFYHANSSLQRLVTQREMRNWAESLGGLAWIIALLGANVFFIYYVFEDEKLYKSLYFCKPAVDDIDVWKLLWITGLTDFVVKFGTVLIKALISLIPRQLLPPKKRGKYFMLFENLSQLYRSLLPIMPWCYFLLNFEHGGQWFSIILMILFTLFKLGQIYKKLKELKNAVIRFRVDVSYGTAPRPEQLQAADNQCPICQDKFTDPVQLSCSHVFCEDCVSMWFDRERTCPMCRASIVDHPQWRDGSTSATIQFY